MVGEDVQVGFDKETVLAAPKVKVDEHLTEGEEHRLYDHYGLSEARGRCEHHPSGGDRPPIAALS